MHIYCSIRSCFTFLLLLTLLLVSPIAHAQSDSTDSRKIPYREATVGHFKIYPALLFNHQARIGFEKIISRHFSGVATAAYIWKGPYGNSDNRFLGACQNFQRTSGTQLQIGVRYYLREERSNFHTYIEANYFYQSLSYRRFRYLPTDACEPFHPWYKYISPLQRDHGIALYAGQQIAAADHIRLEIYLGISLRNRYEDQRQDETEADPPHYTYPSWFLEFREPEAPFRTRYTGFHLGLNFAFGG